MGKGDKQKRKKRIKKDSRYVTNKQLHPELVKFKETGIMSEELGEMCLEIANRMLTRSNFRGYTFKDMMISNAMYSILKYLKNFKPEHPRANGFGYISQIIYNTYRNTIKQQARHSQIKEELYSQRMKLFEKTDYNLKGIDYEQLKKYED